MSATLDAPARVSLAVVGEARRPDTSTLLPLQAYDRVLVAASGGKDSLAATLDLLGRGVPRQQIEWWHQCVDGDPAGPPGFADWPVTDAYVAAAAKALGVRLRRQWREGGFEREMLRDGTRTGAVVFERRDGTFGRVGGTGGKELVRLKFPQRGRIESGRWCSPKLKIDVMASAVSNCPEFAEGRFLVVTGERRQESDARELYATVEKHRTDSTRRRVDHWRPIIEWPEERVWEILARWRVVPHPAYRLGFGRTSCMTCIFLGADEWASLFELDPDRVRRVAAYEAQFGHTITQGLTVLDQAARGRSFMGDKPEWLRRLALGRAYPADGVLLPQGEPWVLPAGAYRRGGGPT
jgi:3'-phosphoadenosine 5'-phosphosulfate sulfotransferase (PAPS reductase)/FAD synthetase